MNDNLDVIIILSNKDWHNDLLQNLKKKFLTIEKNVKIKLFKDSDKFNYESLKNLNPKYIFVIHWGDKIGNDIWGNWETIIFHMTDLPFGRGGSPLQNLILLGKTDTKISAIQCNEELDSGDIYLKKDLKLSGSAQEIFLRAKDIILEMIIEIVIKSPKPRPQLGKLTFFKRRKPSQSDMDNCIFGDINSWYDHIRMLDADGYPHAYIEFNGMKIIFRSAKMESSILTSDVIIQPIDKENL